MAGTYELRIIDGIPGSSQVPGATLLGSWRSILGQAGQTVELWHFANIDQIASAVPAVRPLMKH